MVRLRGKPLGGQIALGSATVLRAPNGIPMLPARLVAQLSRARHDTPVEPVEIIVVARDYDSATSLMLPWARVVGIVAELAADDAQFNGVPAVVGIEGLLEKIDDDALMLIDGERGIVLVDPDVPALAAYQAERERIAPRRRFFLDYSHQPANSLDGREIRVMGTVGSLDEVRQALDSGADTIFVPIENAMLAPDASEEDHLDCLLNLAEAAAGKPITIHWDVQMVSAASILKAARRAEITVVVPLVQGMEYFAELQSYLQETREELLAEDIDFADVRLAGTIQPGDALPEDLGSLFISRVLVTGVRTPLSTGDRAWLEAAEMSTRALLLPLETVVESEADETLLELLALGVDGVMVQPARIGPVKDLIRASNLADVRENLLGSA